MMTSTLDTRRGEELARELQRYIGRGGDCTITASVPVTREAIAIVADAAGDLNPVYRDPDFAARSPHGMLVAPPSSILWWHRSYLDLVPSSHRVDAEGIRHFRLDANPVRQAGLAQTELGLLGEAVSEMADAGYTSTVVTNATARLERYPRVGDILTCAGPTIEAITGPKRTALGPGFFTEASYRLFDQAAETVATWKTTRLYFAPAAADTTANGIPATRAAARSASGIAADPPRAATTGEGERPAAVVATRPDDSEVGQALPPLIIDVTRTLIIAGALATRDPQDVHHDSVLAVRRGFRDIFLNNFTTLAIVSRYVSDWAGPNAVVRGFGFRLQKPQYPDEPLRLSGSITGVERKAGQTALTLAITGTNADGVHIATTFDIDLKP